MSDELAFFAPAAVTSSTHSALGAPGVVALVSNLATTIYVDQATLQRRDVPLWLRDYLAGAGHEIYDISIFPDCLVGCRFEDAAAFVYDTTGAVLVATDAYHAVGAGADLRLAPFGQVCVAWVLCCHSCLSLTHSHTTSLTKTSSTQIPLSLPRRTQTKTPKN